MRVGIFLNNLHEESGGSYTFLCNLLHEIDIIAASHRVHIFYKGALHLKFSDSIRTINIDAQPPSPDAGNNQNSENRVAALLRRAGNRARRLILGEYISGIQQQVDFLKNRLDFFNYNSNYDNALNQAVLKNEIDLVWFISPLYLPVQVPFIYTLWDLAHREHPYFPEVTRSGEWEARENYYKGIVNKAAYIITGTKAGKEALGAYYNVNSESIRVVPFFTPRLDRMSADDGDGIQAIAKKPYIFYPAQFWPHKNHVLILEAVKILKERHAITPDVVFCGSDKGNLAYIKEKADEYGLTAQVHFLGFVSLGELVSLYKNAFALVYPTYFGPDNLPPLEAMSLGCPVIASKVSGALDQLGDAALLFSPGEKIELADALLKLLQEPDLRNAFIEKGFLQSSKFTSEDYLKSIAAILDEFGAIRQCWSSKYD